MEIEVPRIKKRINAFLVGEDGKISKQSLLAIGTALGTAALSNIGSAVHSNSVTSIANTGTILHTHHSSHNSHSSHGSHGSHGSHSSHGSHCSW